MKKRALGIILSVLCVLLLFSACGGKDKKEKKKSDEAKVKVEKEESEEKEGFNNNKRVVLNFIRQC